MEMETKNGEDIYEEEVPTSVRAKLLAKKPRHDARYIGAGGMIRWLEEQGYFESEETSVKESMDEICEALEKEILQSGAGDEEKQILLARLRKLCSTKTNIMLVGATGCG